MRGRKVKGEVPSVNDPSRASYITGPEPFSSQGKSLHAWKCAVETVMLEDLLETQKFWQMATCICTLSIR